MIFSSKYKYNSLKLKREKCIGCKMCTIVCPHRVFVMKDKKAFMDDSTKCMECGACMKNCPVDAIEVDSGVGCAGAMISTAIFGKGRCCGGECSCDDLKDELEKRKKKK